MMVRWMSILCVGLGLLGLPAQAKTKKNKQVVRSELSKSLDNKVYLMTSFGMAGLLESETATLGGVADMSVLYDLDMKILGRTFGSYRYLPMGATIQEKVAGSTVEYRGVIEGHLVGAHLEVMKSSSMMLQASGELGLVKQGLYDQVTKKSKTDFGFLAVAGALAEWPMAEDFGVHAKLNIGFGSYALWQLSGGASLAF